jgi:hypothetical protein
MPPPALTVTSTADLVVVATGFGTYDNKIWDADGTQWDKGG